MGHTSYFVSVLLNRFAEVYQEMSNEERPTGTLFVIGVLVATILVFWGGVFYLFLKRS